jgi:hypothetical protein
MEPVTLAAVTSALTLLGSEAAKGIISESGKDLWKIAKERFGWSTDPPADSLAIDIANRLKGDESLTNELAELLKSRPDVGVASALVGRIEAGKVIVASSISVSRDFKM